MGSMFSSKQKGLFVDFSEFSVLAARTSGYRLPMVLEEIAELPRKDDQAPKEIRSFIENLINFKGADYVIARCGAYPRNRFIRNYEAETLNKARDPKFLGEVLRSEFGLDSEANIISILDARDGSDFDMEKGLGKKLVFCGAPKKEWQEKQDELLESGVYPDRLELSTLTTLGGVCDYARFNKIEAPILCFELTPTNANVFVQKRGQLEVARPIPFGFNDIYPLLQRELGLKDEASARKLFFSNTFDFAEIGPKLLRRMTKELQATTGFYEVQTGQTIDQLYISVLPSNLAWVSRTISESLGLELILPKYEPWLESLNIKIGDSVDLTNLGSRWLGLFSLMGEFHLREEVAGE